MWSWGSLLTYLGLVLILVGGLRGGAEHSGGLALIGLLILGLITYPPPDARREAQAVLVLSGVAGLVALWSLEGQVRAGAGGPQVMDDLLVLGGAAMVLVHAAADLLQEPSRPHGATNFRGAAGRLPWVSEPVLWHDMPQGRIREGAAPGVGPQEEGGRTVVTRIS
jgi:hypothetical protein